MSNQREERTTCDKEQFSLNLARLKKAGDTFEVVVDPELCFKLKRGDAIEITDILQSENIFKDANRGELASEHEIKKVLGTDDPLVAAKIIITEGQIHLTKKQRDQMRNEKRSAIISAIHRYGVDPRTKAPHPMNRIEAALEQAKVQIDEFQSASDQVPVILRKLQPILPISFETKKVQVKLAAADAAKCYPVVKQVATIKKEEWLNDGSWMAEIEFPGGLEEEVYDKLNKASHGNIEINQLK